MEKISSTLTVETRFIFPLNLIPLLIDNLGKIHDGRMEKLEKRCRVLEFDRTTVSKMSIGEIVILFNTQAEVILEYYIVKLVHSNMEKLLEPACSCGILAIESKSIIATSFICPQCENHVSPINYDQGQQFYCTVCKEITGGIVTNLEVTCHCGNNYDINKSNYYHFLKIIQNLYRIPTMFIGKHAIHTAKYETLSD